MHGSKHNACIVKFIKERSILTTQLKIMDDKHDKAKVQRILMFSRTDLKESILRTFGAGGIIINKEFVKNVIRRRASKFVGTFMADSLTVKSKWSLITYRKK